MFFSLRRFIVGDLKLFVSVAQKKFPSLIIGSFTSNEIQEAT